MTEYKIKNATPSLTRFRVLRNSDIADLADSINGKVNTTVQPDFNPAPITITPVIIPEPAVEVEPVITPEETVIEEPTVEETTTEETVEPAVEETTEETATEENTTDISVLNLSAANEKNLRSNDITTVEALVAFTAENDLESLPKIGSKAKEVILEALRKWQEEQSQN